MMEKCLEYHCHGYYPHHHKSEKADKYLNKQILEAIFPVFSRIHITCGALREAKSSTTGTGKPLCMMRYKKCADKATSLKTGVSRQGLRKADPTGTL
jgi:hypothetical protein